MVVDIGEVKRHIKPKADSTLRNMRKDDLIEYIRCLENNYNTAVSFNENQARYIESLDVVEVVRCKDCVHWYEPDGVCLKIYSDGAVSPYAWQDRNQDDFCSYGERKDND